MHKYRKKPVVIEAMQVPPLTLVDPRMILDEWLFENQGDTPLRYVGDEIIIPTLEGEMRAQIGDWIIKGVNGELYPCKPDIFEKTYEPAQ